MPENSDSTEHTQRRMGVGMLVAMWLLVLGLLSFLFSALINTQNNPNRHVDSLAGQDGSVEVLLQANRFGHYVVSGLINQKPAQFLIDSGATEISIPASVAKSIGLNAGRSQMVRTAAGPIRVYATLLDSVAIGDIQLHKVRGHINPQMDGEEVLLGMSFLGRLEMEQKNSQLRLRYPSN